MKPTEDVLDREAALSAALHDPSLLSQLVGLFAGYYPGLLDDIRDAVSAQDSVQVRETVHRLKGAVGTFHSREAFQTARKLEAMAKDGELADAMLTYRQLAEQVLTLAAVLDHLVLELQSETANG